MLQCKESQFKYVVGGDGKPKSMSVSDIEHEEIKYGKKVPRFNSYKECAQYILSSKQLLNEVTNEIRI